MSRIMTNLRTPSLAAMLLAALVLAGCATPLARPDAPVTLPANWDEATSRTDNAARIEADWWAGFGSAELQQLIATALAGSPDLAIATERVVQAEIATRNAGATLFPTVDLDLATGARATEGGNASGTTRSSSAALGIRYEIDIWGSNLQRLRGARAQLAASHHDYEATRLSLLAGVVNAYARVVAQRARVQIASENLAIAERLFTLVEARYRHGAASALDVSRQRTAVLAQRAAIVPMQAQERESLRALAILVGRIPQQFDVGGRSLAGIEIPEVDAPLPGELLARRPDLAAAEARLVAADANIAVARAALFPVRLSLGLTATAAGNELGFVGLGSPLGTAAITLSLLQTVFDGGRLQGQVETTESQRRQLLETYRTAVLGALKEVEDALSAVERSRSEEQAQAQIRTETERTLRLSELRYREGSDRLDTLLDAQRSLFSAQDQLIQTRLARINASVDLYKALGGGWRLGNRT
jgi:outer membrane protein, multidrug efflux system